MSVEVIDNLFKGVAERTHAHDDAISVVSAIVVEQVIAGAKLLVDLVHVGLNNGGQSVIGLVASLTMLEEDVAVLMGAACMRMLRIEGVIAERLDSVHVEHVLQIVEVPNSNLLNLVRSAEAVKEVQERNLALNSCKVSNGCEIHYFLDIALSEHGKAGLTASHNIGVIAENVKRVGATVRADTWKTPGRPSPAILYIFGIMRSRPCDAV